MVKRQARVSVIRDWAKFPEFAKVLEAELENLYKESSEIFVSGNPHLTHEQKAKLIGREGLLLELLALFQDGNVEMFFNERNGVELLYEQEETRNDDAE